MLTMFGNLALPVLIRAFAAFFLAFVLSLILGNKTIYYLKKFQQHGQPIRDDGPQSHIQTKQGTPTMGGLLILLTSMLSIILFANITYHFVWVVLLVMLVFGITGFIDDYIKVSKQTPNALTAKAKLFVQFMTAVVAVTIVTAATPSATSTVLSIPYLKMVLNLSWLYIPFAVIVISGTSNAVNLTDGLDGLASGLLILVFIFFFSVAFISGSSLASDFSFVYIPKSSEISVICASLAGSCLGFLWFNAPKAKVFMGDTGSLALGAVLGTIAVIVKQEILLAIVGGVFVMETLSVMIQVFWYKKTGKRFFKMAPIHHHFEQLGWKETTVVVRFWIVGFVLALLGFAALINF
ncbi:MAG: phospho-N-acetylmuramoyl-pentapeptide-transferase [Alphaproteobacteria bacterium]|nr:phospho-N-acetylmuramoyl-pentapeptide-transferase [Alphaproteobacteria bacterium]